jgi:hypothetical protein
LAWLSGAGGDRRSEFGHWPAAKIATPRVLARGTMPNMAHLRVSIVFQSGARIGPGKARLLESIRNTGSISAAAREMGMSYKRAWVLLDSIIRHLPSRL